MSSTTKASKAVTARASQRLAKVQPEGGEMQQPQVGDMIQEGPWAGFTLISRYTRAEGIADGILVDVSETAREAGFTVPVALTSAVSALIEPTEQEQGYGQDAAGRLWDLLWMCRDAIRRASTPSTGELPFQVLVQVRGRAHKNGLTKLRFKVHSGPGDEGEHVLTIMLPEED